MWHSAICNDLTQWLIHFIWRQRDVTDTEDMVLSPEYSIHVWLEFSDTLYWTWCILVLYGMLNVLYLLFIIWCMCVRACMCASIHASVHVCVYACMCASVGGSLRLICSYCCMSSFWLTDGEPSWLGVEAHWPVLYRGLYPCMLSRTHTAASGHHSLTHLTHLNRGRGPLCICSCTTQQFGM